MAVDFEEENKERNKGRVEQEFESLSIDFDTVPAAASPVGSQIQKNSQIRKSFLGNMSKAIVQGNAEKARSDFYRSAEAIEEGGFGDVPRFELAAKENKMMSVQGAIDDLLLDKELSSFEKNDAINRLLEKQQNLQADTEKYALNTVAMAVGDNPIREAAIEEMADLEVRDYVQKRMGEVVPDDFLNQLYVGFKEQMSFKNFADMVRGDYSPEQEERTEILSDAVVSMVTPGIYGAYYRRLGAKVFPEKFGDAGGQVAGQVASGEVIDELHDVFRSSDTEKKIKTVDSVIEFLKNEDYLGNSEGDSFLSVMAASEIFGAYLEGDVEGFNWDRLFGNLASATDATVIGGSAVRAGSFFKRMGTLYKLNQETKAGRAAADVEIIRDESGVIGKSFGTTKEDTIVESFYPSKEQEQIVKADLRTFISEELKRGSGFNYLSNDEKAMIAAGLEKELAKEEFTGAVYKPSASQVRVSDENIEIDMVFGQSGQAGFRNPQDAMSTARNLNPYLREDQIKVYQDVDGEIIQVDPAKVKAKTDRGVEGYFEERSFEAVDKGRIKKVLGNKYKDSDVSRDDFIRARVDTGAKVEEVDGQRLLVTGDGRRLTEKDLTKTGMDYAEYLSDAAQGEQYYFGYTQRRQFNAEQLRTYTDLGFNSTQASFIAKTPGFFATSPRTKIDQTYVDTASIAENLTARAERAFNEYIRPFASLNFTRENSAKVLSAVKDAAGDGGWHDAATLATKYGMNNKEITVYNRLADLQDLQYVISNNKMYQSRLSRGLQTIETFHGERSVTFTGKVFKSADDANSSVRATETKKKIYDFENDEQVFINTKEDLDAYYEEGYRLVRLEDSVGDDIEYGLIKIDGGDSVVRQLSPFQLPYIPGYYTRIDKNNYFVSDSAGRVVASGATASNAVKNAEEMGLQDYSIRLGTELESEKGVPFSDVAAEYAKNQGIIFGSRGDEALYGADLADPIESAVISTGYLSRMSGTGEWSSQMKARFMNEWGEDLGLSSGGVDKWPESTSALKKLIDGFPVGEQQEILTAYRYIDMISGAGQTQLGRAAAREMVRGASALEELASKSKGLKSKAASIGSKAILAAKDTDPISALRAASFTALVSTAPLRQLLLQSLQPTMLFSVNPKYMLNPNGLMGDHTLMIDLLVRDKMYEKLGKGSWSMDNIDHIAKSWGRSKEETKALIKGFKDSGLMQIIDYNILSREASKMAEAAALGKNKSFSKGVWWTGTVPLNMVKRVGFDAGEFNNQLASYLIAWDKYKRDNPNANMTSPETVRRVVGLTNRYSLGMSGRANQMQYSDGFLSVPMQFFSIQHKAALAWWPARAGGDPSFTAGQKLGMFGVQANLFGLDALGVTMITDKIIEASGTELTGEQRLYLQGGVMDLIASKHLGILVSEHLSPAGGQSLPNMATTVPDMIDAIYTEGVDGLLESLNVAFGPSATVFSRTKAVIETGIGMFAYQPISEIGREDMATFAAMTRAISSQGSRYAQMQTALATGELYNTKGEKLYEGLTDTQAIAVGALGFQPDEVSELYKLTFDKVGDSAGSMEYTPNDQKKDAEAMLRFVNQELMHGGFINDLPKDAGDLERAVMINHERVLRANRILNYVIQHYPEDAKAELRKAFRNALKQDKIDQVGGGKVDNLLKRHIENLKKFKISGSAAKDTYNTLKTLETMLPEDSSDKYIIDSLLENYHQRSKYVNEAAEEGAANQLEMLENQ